MRVAVVGNGGSGKSVIAGTMARVLARRGAQVLALDSDLMPGLALSLGVTEPAEPPLAQAAECNEQGRWRLKKGIGPVRAVQRYSTPATDGVWLLQVGKTGRDGLPPMASVQAFYSVIHRLRSAATFRDWTFVGDLPAGPRQAAFDWAPYADVFLVVVEPTWKSGLTGRRVARIARGKGAIALPVANKASTSADRDLIEEIIGEEVFAAIPADRAVIAADCAGVALLDHDPAAGSVCAIESLIDTLDSQYAVSTVSKQ